MDDERRFLELRVTESCQQRLKAKCTKQGCELDRILLEFNLIYESDFSNLIIYEFDKNKLFRGQVLVQADEYPKSRLFLRRCSCN